MRTSMWGGARRAQVRITYAATLLGLLLGVWMLSHHVPRRFVEAELALPALLLLIIGRAIFVLERQRAETLPLAPLVAIVGCDGSGKSTLAADLLRALSRERAVATCYLGLGTGDLGNRIKRLPLIGPAVEARLARKAGQIRNAADTIPGLASALVVFGLSLLRLRRFRRMLALRRSGVTVITDRYPQAEIGGFFDGPGLSAAAAGSPLVAWLAARERGLYARMAAVHPTAIIRLSVSAETALRRKPDHQRALLERKVAVAPLLRFGGARIIDVDAEAAYRDVRRSALESVRYILSHEQPVRQPAGAFGPVQVAWRQ